MSRRRRSTSPPFLEDWLLDIAINWNGGIPSSAGDGPIVHGAENESPFTPPTHLNVAEAAHVEDSEPTSLDAEDLTDSLPLTRSNSTITLSSLSSHSAMSSSMGSDYKDPNNVSARDDHLSQSSTEQAGPSTTTPLHPYSREASTSSLCRASLQSVRVLALSLQMKTISS
ncbi:hypothetical protein JTE90_021400 [Oedothorax gibbosus]|uniref:Uncharacterized protein n=1 Tax=Oedothorax gibbosus TaxID=931172 RepID=A0AAV6VED0_9ARAC|nr:hypothetical protein JTE90_021400 [Oedothorax gibbosus]